jgi:hypothetical protein
MPASRHLAEFLHMRRGRRPTSADPDASSGPCQNAAVRLTSGNGPEQFDRIRVSNVEALSLMSRADGRPATGRAWGGVRISP